MKNKILTCIGCPLGCQINVQMEDNEIIKLTGYTCPIGERYAREEVTNPVRVLTSVVKTLSGTQRVLPVKTEGKIPKDKIMDCMEEIKTLAVQAPVEEGEVLLENISGTGINLIATRRLVV